MRICAHCGKDKADKLVLRDEYGTVRGSSFLSVPEAVEMLRERSYSMIDRGMDVSLSMECKDCRDDFRRQEDLEANEDLYV